MISTEEFILRLWEACKPKNSICEVADIFLYGRQQGWLEEQDLLYKEFIIDRRSAARIIHELLRIEAGIRDVEDWKNARRIKDIYDCKVCAKHVAQVYEQGIMIKLENGRFNLLGKVSREDMLIILERIEKLLNNKE